MPREQRLMKRCSLAADHEMIFRLSSYCSVIVIAVVIAIVISGVSLLLACCLQWLLFFIVIYNGSAREGGIYNHCPGAWIPAIAASDVPQGDEALVPQH
jgi:hypothetical protein